jgi:hypothetical protein
LSALRTLFYPFVPIGHLKVWVLAPSINNPDPNLAYYYDFSQSIEEYTRVFESLDIPWKWQPVSLEDYKKIIQEIAGERDKGIYFPVVLNLCDGDVLLCCLNNLFKLPFHLSTFVSRASALTRISFET